MSKRFSFEKFYPADTKLYIPVVKECMFVLEWKFGIEEVKKSVKMFTTMEEAFDYSRKIEKDLEKLTDLKQTSCRIYCNGEEQPDPAVCFWSTYTFDGHLKGSDFPVSITYTYYQFRVE